MTRLRTVLLVCALLFTAAGCELAAPGQRESEEKVTILGTWTGSQEKEFKKLLGTIGIPYEYQGTAAQREVLLSEVQAGEPPDIVIMPGIGELAEYAHQKRLERLDGLGVYNKDEYGPPWQPSGKGAGPVYWVPLRADLKSIVWHRKNTEPPKSPQPLASWCIGMGDDGPSGWPGTDWIEDLVLQREGPEDYERWVRGKLKWTSPKVRDAWLAWGSLLAENRDLAKAALTADHRGPDDSNGLLFGKGDCTLEHQGSFAPFFYGDRAREATFEDSADLLPGGPYDVMAHEVTGDFAALFSDSDQAGKLLRELASARHQNAWADSAGVFSANNRVRPRSGDVEREIAERLTTEHTPRCLDASDVMLPAVRDAFYEATLLTLTRYSQGRGPGSVRGILDDVQLVQDAQADNPVTRSEVCSTPQ